MVFTKSLCLCAIYLNSKNTMISPDLRLSTTPLRSAMPPGTCTVGREAMAIPAKSMAFPDLSVPSALTGLEHAPLMAGAATVPLSAASRSPTVFVVSTDDLHWQTRQWIRASV